MSPSRDTGVSSANAANGDEERTPANEEMQHTPTDNVRHLQLGPSQNSGVSAPAANAEVERAPAPADHLLTFLTR